LGEILTNGETPYKELTNQDLVKFIPRGLIQNIDKNCPEFMYSKIFSCFFTKFPFLKPNTYLIKTLIAES
jgi:hypothetical protein